MLLCRESVGGLFLANNPLFLFPIHTQSPGSNQNTAGLYKKEKLIETPKFIKFFSPLGKSLEWDLYFSGSLVVMPEGREVEDGSVVNQGSSGNKRPLEPDVFS